MFIPDRKICVVGAGGFGREVMCCLQDALKPAGLDVREAACFMVSDDHVVSDRLMGVEVIARSDFDAARYDVVVAIGDPSARKAMVQDLPAQTRFVTIIHPTAVVSEWVELGEGNIVTAGTMLTCGIRTGRHVQLNLHTTVGHDCMLGDFCTTAPAVNISGNCTLGEGVYAGTNACIRQGIRIGDWVTLGMGAVVVKDIAEGGVHVGNPARLLQRD